MQLNINQIKDITLGSSYIIQGKNGIEFHRFTKEQEELYGKTNGEFLSRGFSASGIKLSFRTGSNRLTLKITASKAINNRSYFSFDIFCNGTLIGNIDNFSNMHLPDDNYMWVEAPLGKFEKSFELGAGMKDLCIHFPWSAAVSVEELSLDDESFVEAIRPTKKLIAFGDSITHGFDAVHPSNRYVARLAQALDAEEYNKAIGGERFFPELAECKDELSPDYITVAYGTNDWAGGGTLAEFKDRCRRFFKSLSINYPDSKIFAITPIWRKDMDMPDRFCRFEDINGVIYSLVKDIKNVSVISGIDLVPHDEKLYGDLRLHPNDEGFEYYFKNLYHNIKSYI